MGGARDKEAQSDILFEGHLEQGPVSPSQGEGYGRKGERTVPTNLFVISVDDI